MASIYTQCFTNAAISDEKWCKNCQSMTTERLPSHYKSMAVSEVAMLQGTLARGKHPRYHTSLSRRGHHRTAYLRRVSCITALTEIANLDSCAHTSMSTTCAVSMAILEDAAWSSKNPREVSELSVVFQTILCTAKNEWLFF